MIDKKILFGGASILTVGVIIYLISSMSMPVGVPGMTEEETLELLMAQEEAENINTLSGIMVGIGFLLILISFGARKRRKRDDKGIKTIEKKPA